MKNSNVSLRANLIGELIHEGQLISTKKFIEKFRSEELSYFPLELLMNGNIQYNTILKIEIHQDSQIKEIEFPAFIAERMMNYICSRRNHEEDCCSFVSHLNFGKNDNVLENSLQFITSKEIMTPNCVEMGATPEGSTHKLLIGTV